ncbi:ankyrin repeat domain-containing protein, partial [Methylotenera sp.]|uniref:ankyrin repeat domain-containing protein n=1 Tax=Methylotenera sp. TaxID=2051956 RepID=UPI00351D1058
MFSVAFPAVAEDLSYLLTAASKGDVATVNAMLASGASANAKDVDGVTALMYAARKDQAEVATRLISKGADVNAKDKGGW